MLRYVVLLLVGFTLLVTGCSPVYNWREVSLSKAGLKLLLPCKPDQGHRTMSLGGQALEMQMAGCEADAALFAIAHADLGDSGKTEAAMKQWKTAMLGNMQAQERVQLSDFMTQGASAQPQPLRLAAKGRRQDGSTVAAQGVWFARGAHLYHAVVYADKLNQEAVDTFFSGIELQ
jgi:hypothetical protein